MNDITRRDALKAGGATVAAALLPSDVVQAAPTWNGPAPEPGAQIRVLRWKQFVQSEFDSFAANTKKFADQTGVKIRVDAESWDDIRPKAAVAANVGGGPDIIMGTNDDPFKFPDKLLDMTDLAEYLGAKYGGWYPVTRKYGMLRDRWIALPQGSPIGTFNYRISAMRAAGFEEFPKDTAGFLKLCQGLRKVGKPAGFSLGHATGDANGWTHWCLWAHGGKMVDDSNNVVLDSPETVAALEYAMQLYVNFIEGVLSWLDPSNNKSFLSDQIGVTTNGISIYTVAKNSPDPALKAIAADMNHANAPIGPVGRPTELQLMLNTYAYQLHQVSKRGAGISALHVGEGTSRCLAESCERLCLASAASLERQSSVDRRSQGHALPRWAEVCARQRLLRVARQGLGRGNRRFRGRRHVRRGVHRKPDAKGGCAASRRTRQTLLSGLRRIIRHATPG